MPTRPSDGAPEGRILRLAAATALKSVLIEMAKAKKNAKTHTEAAKKAIAEFISTKHGHKLALAVYGRFDKLTDEDLAEALAHFDHYRKVGGLDARADAVGELFDRKLDDDKKPAPGTPPGERDVRPGFLKDRGDDETPAKH